MGNDRLPHLPRRMSEIESFRVMDLLARARELEAAGRDIVHMEIGEPDFSTPEPVVAAGMEALRRGITHYTPALGLPPLRAKIAQHYSSAYHVDVDPAQVVITPGASGALLLALGVLVDPGSRVLMSDPGYPCNRNFIRFLEGSAVKIPVGPETRYQLSSELIGRHWDEATVAAIVASPSNPTGTMLRRHELAALVAAVEGRGGRLIADEIYHGLVYGQTAVSALQISGNAFVINSFSKYFQMTGWRLGWMVVPRQYLREVEKLVQNLFIAAPTPAQYAALAAFDEPTLAILETRRVEFERRRDYLVPALQQLGFEISVVPDGAFYIYADCSRLTADSQSFCHRLLEEAGVAVTPGADFGEYLSARYLRFAYTTDLPRLEEGVARIGRYLGA